MSALEVRCSRCRAALAVLVPEGHVYAPKGKYRPLVVTVHGDEDRDAKVRFPRCEKCYLWRGNFVGRLPRVIAASAKDTPGRVPDMLTVAWSELRMSYFDALSRRAAVAVKVTDDGRVIP